MYEKSEETLESGSIVVPKDVANAFGRGLRQSFSGPMQTINLTINNLEANPGPNEKRITSIKKNIKRITDILNGLEKAKEAKILVHQGGNDFQFSEEKKPKIHLFLHQAKY